ncbi:MAG TPA: sigma-70 family RNA polymerase sigma factor [Capsulimonadaceae bacterium]|jgi:RNA polymerase sigma-70 factor (ECF subfamily)
MSDTTPASLRADSASKADDSAGAKKQPAGDGLPPDRLLIGRCQRGDVEAFNLLIQRYERVVYNFAFRLSGNYDDANDIAQDAFVRAYNAIGSFRGDAQFSTWIFRITTNVYLDEKKKRKAHPQSSLDEYIETEESSMGRQVEDPSPTPEEIVTDNERSQFITKAIQSLPEFQRTMVVLYHVEHKSYEEIADIMELPIGTVKSRLNRARLALKEKLSALKELF